MKRKELKRWVIRAGYTGLAFAVMAGTLDFPEAGPIAGMCIAFAFGVSIGLDAEDD